MTDLEIEDAIREAWTILQTGAAASASARRLAAALLALIGGTSAQPHWITPDDVWSDRLAVLADQGAWLAVWGPRPGEPDCRVPRALLPESRARRQNAYALWRSVVQTGTSATDESHTESKPASRPRRRDDAEQTGSARPKGRRARARAAELEPGDEQG